MKQLSLYLKPFICLLFILSAGDVNAQVALVQRAVDQIAGYDHFSYQLVYQEKEYTNDTIVLIKKDMFVKAPEDSTIGYFFRMESLTKGNQFPYIALYNGQNLITVHPEDSTYALEKIGPRPFDRSLPAFLKLIGNLLTKKPSQMAADTLIDGRNCAYIVMDTYDTIIGKEHLYTRFHIFMDKLSGLPHRIIIKSRHARSGDGITNYYAAYYYSDYKLNEGSVDMAAIAIPKGFHPPRESAPLPALLTPGTVAPDWVLYNTAGKKLSLSQLKGKVVMLDFFFIGCSACMLSLKPLNNIHEKYKNKNVVLVSMTSRDRKEAATKFSKNYHLKYPVYLNSADVEKAYHVTGAPTFYFIDPKGKIAAVIPGYVDDFEARVTSTIDKMLSE